MYAAMGIRTPVAGVRGPHDWPDYTIAATALSYEAYSYLNLLIIALPALNTGAGEVSLDKIPEGRPFPVSTADDGIAVC